LGKIEKEKGTRKNKKGTTRRPFQLSIKKKKKVEKRRGKKGIKK